MPFTERFVAGALFLTVQDERLDAFNADHFKSGIVDFMQSGHERFVLDLSNVRFMDSRALGMLISIKKTMADAGCFCILCPNKNVRSLFTMTRLDRIFHIFVSEEDVLTEAAKMSSGDQNGGAR